MLATAERGAELSAPGSGDRLDFVDRRARARLELGEYEALETALTELLVGAPKFRTLAFGYRAIAELRKRRFADALRTAEEGLAVEHGRFWRHELLAVRFEASRALEPSRAIDPLEPATLAALRRRRCENWAERLSCVT